MRGYWRWAATAKIHFTQPPVATGSEREQLEKLQRYLVRMAKDLNLALGSVESGTYVREGGAGGKAADPAVQKALEQQAEQLRSLIVKTADEVHAEYEELTESLASNYIAKSEWGTYEEIIRQEIVSTSEGIVRSFDYDSRIESLQKDAAGFDAFRTQSEGTIRQGIVGYNGASPVIGIAIGQNLKVTQEQVTVDGVAYDVLEEGQAMGVYTATGLEFWQNGRKVAYLSNNRLVITDAEISGSLITGKWEISTARGFTLRWVGE